MAIARWKNPRDYTTAEMIAAKAAAGRGEEFRVEAEDWRAARAVALDAAGLEAEDDDGNVPLEEMTPEQHARRKQRAPKW